MKLLLFSAFIFTTSIITMVLPLSYRPREAVVVGYYADWTAQKYPPEQIPYQKLTHINYAFGVVDKDYKITFSTQALLDKVVKLAHEKKTKVLLSLGGWTGSQYFSPLVKLATARKNLIGSIVELINTHKLDGIDIDWEFPGRVGLECNKVDPLVDSSNFLSLLKELRNALDGEYGKGKKALTLAVRIEPFDGPNGPLTDVKSYSNYVDFINIMAYDINGAWSEKTGPNAPFNDGKQSLVGSVDAWTKAGWPATKIVAGLPFYGRAVTATEARSNYGSALGLSVTKTVPKGDDDDALWAEPCEGKVPVFSGIWQWRNVNKQLLGKWKGGWDKKSQTPWLWNDETKTFITYDDPKSIGIKTDWARCRGLAGVMIWALHNDDGKLIDAAQTIHRRGSC